MLEAEKVKEYARRCGADLVGIASMDRFEGAPRQWDPRHIMPEAKSLIVMGFRIFRGLLRGIEEGTFFIGYSSMGYAGINWIQQPVVLWNFCKKLEEKGYETLPIPNIDQWSAINLHTDGTLKEGWSRPVSPDKPAPDVSVHLRISAFLAGLGEIGYSKLLLTPKFGPRQRLAAVLTEAPLEPDPMYEEPKLCDRCMLCVKNCPGQAISGTEIVRIKVAGRWIEYGKFDSRRCSKGMSGAEVNPDGTVKNLRTFNPFLGEVPPQYWYGRAIEGAQCIRTCMDHLERKGVLKNKFEKPFRRKKPWRLD